MTGFLALTFPMTPLAYINQELLLARCPTTPRYHTSCIYITPEWRRWKHNKTGLHPEKTPHFRHGKINPAYKWWRL